MDIKEILRNNLRYAVWLKGGYSALAENSDGGNEKYFYQIVSGFQGKKDKTPRSLGKDVASAVAAAIGEDKTWMYQEHPELWEKIDVVNEPPKAKKKSSNVHAIETKTDRARDIDEIILLLKKTKDTGVAMVLKAAREAYAERPMEKTG